MNTVFLETPHSTQVQSRFYMLPTAEFASNLRSRATGEQNNIGQKAQKSLVIDDISLLVIEISYNLGMRKP